MIMGFIWLSAFTALASIITSGVSAQNTTSAAPTVSLNGNITVVGVRSVYDLDTFLGIPYAQPPVGQLRYAAPVPAVAPASGVINASAYGPVCMQADSTTYPLSSVSEDCLSVNVVRPPGLNTTAKLPVMVWIYGGAYLYGGSAQYNPTILVGRSIQLGEPVIYVSLNYRLNSFGFLASDEVATAAKNDTATLNAGLYDIQAALLWVQQNIDSFGGDHTKVTAVGESAGAISIGSLLVADGGKALEKLGLFRGAIMESGAPSGDGVPTPAYLETGYQSFASLAGCGSALANGTSLACLRALPTAVVFNATLALLSQSTFALPWNRVIDGYFHDVLPSVQVRAKRLATVPLMIGNNLDEGTYFSSSKVNTSAELTPALIAFLYSNNAPSSFRTQTLPELLKLYPDDPSLGSPFAPFNVSTSDRFFPPAATNQYKRYSAIIGDSLFQAGRRLLLNAYTSMDENYPVYNYLFTANTPGTDPSLGVFHSSEIPFVYGYENSTNALGKTSLFMLDSWIAFVNTLNPNRPSLPTWPKYGTALNTLQIGTETKTGAVTQLIKDTYREAGIAFLGTEAWTAAGNL